MRGTLTLGLQDRQQHETARDLRGHAATMSVFGETPSGIRIGLILVNVASTVLIFFLAKYLYGWLAGTVAGMTYSFLSARRCWASTLLRRAIPHSPGRNFRVQRWASCW